MIRYIKKQVVTWMPAPARRFLVAVRTGLREQQELERRRNRRSKAITVANEFANSRRPLRLELGAGSRKGHGEWVTLDRNNACDIWWDLTEGLPFPDESISTIYSSHVLEHFPYPEMQTLLRECLRVLKPNADFLVAVPNASIYMRAYVEGRQLDHDRYFPYKPAFHFNSSIDYVNYTAYMDQQHHHMFDETNLLAVLRDNGFRDVSLREFDADIDSRERDYESIYARAKK